ncbi:hypothetical protein DIPPA_09263 [Diplonema papillatum]|nr:hypothetical protein DIPPA_09263 [Diplonema papillatum]
MFLSTALAGGESIRFVVVRNPDLVMIQAGARFAYYDDVSGVIEMRETRRTYFRVYKNAELNLAALEVVSHALAKAGRRGFLTVDPVNERVVVHETPTFECSFYRLLDPSSGDALGSARSFVDDVLAGFEKESGAASSMAAFTATARFVECLRLARAFCRAGDSHGVCGVLDLNDIAEKAGSLARQGDRIQSDLSTVQSVTGPGFGPARPRNCRLRARVAGAGCRS